MSLRLTAEVNALREALTALEARVEALERGGQQIPPALVSGIQEAVHGFVEPPKRRGRPRKHA
jgi:hypothetical protein